MKSSRDKVFEGTAHNERGAMVSGARSHRNGVGFLIALIVIVIVPQAIFEYSEPYSAALARHTEGRVLWRGRKPLLYMTYFRNGDTKYAEETAIYLPEDGNASCFLRKRRVLWNYATQGGGQNVSPGTPEFSSVTKLANMPPIPEGLSFPEKVFPNRLLIVSQRSGGKWLTRYYDRGRLPREIDQILDVVRDYRPANAEKMGWAPAAWPPPAVKG